ncbi:MAG TPA: hypothetical protein EYQ00_11935 [Dehalococcoidia bacterium]|nr:hypothetical protein [Dehalococcoidia bacterium]
MKKARKSTDPSALTSGSETLNPSLRRQAANSEVSSSSVLVTSTSSEVAFVAVAVSDLTASAVA